MGERDVRTAIRTNQSRRQVSTGRSIPAPVGGWDAQAPLANMKPQNAVILDNWIPRPGYVEMRRGSVKILTTGAKVETVMAWRGSTVDQLLACHAGTITTADGTEVFTGALNNRWQSINFSNDAGRFLLMVNGANEPKAYDGAATINLTISGASGPITLDPATLSDVMAFKSRMFFIEKNTMRVWFLDVEAIQGTAQLLDLGPVFQKGGVLTCMQPWSLDGGNGADDYAVFMSSQGEVAIYQGLDPSDATNWALVGTFSLGMPLGQRTLLKYGSDLAVITTDGVVPLSQALKLDRAQGNLVALTQKIQNAFASATTRYKSLFGWQGTFYQRGSLAIFNVPTSATTSQQFVQNVQTGAWCRFTGINSLCWTIANENPYFGGVDGLFQWDLGSTDDGTGITADLETAFNYFGERGRNKKFEMIRPIIEAAQSVQPALELVTDFKNVTPTAVPTVVVGDVSLWGTTLWGSGLWADVETIRTDWTSVTGIGYCAAARMRVVTAPATYGLLSVDGTDTLEDGEGDDIATSGDVVGPEVSVHLIGFDLIFQSGGQL